MERASSNVGRRSRHRADFSIRPRIRLAFGAYADLPFWAQSIEALYPLDFAYGERVYYTYGWLYFLTLLPELLSLYVLRRLRGGGSGRWNGVGSGCRWSVCR